MTKQEKILLHFEQRCEQIIKNSTVKVQTESASDKKARIRYLLGDYGSFFSYYFAHYCDNGKTPCAPYHVKAAHKIAKNRIITFFALWHRGAAKSTHANVGIPLFLMFRGEMKFMVIMGYNRAKSLRLLADVQAELKVNQRIIEDFGEQFSYGDWSNGSFISKGGTAFEAVSVLQDPSGLRNGPHRIDYASVDDTDNRRKARNKEYVNLVVENVIGGLREGMDKDKQRVVIANNYKVKDGVIARLLRKVRKQPSTCISKVNAVDKEGNPTWCRYTKQYWDNKKANTDDLTWLREYMNTPVEGGSVFKENQYIWGKMPQWKEFESIVVYGDLSYTQQGDTKAWAPLCKLGRKYYLPKVFCRNTDLTVAVKWLYDLFDSHLKNLDDVSYYYDGRFAQKEVYDPEFDEEGEERGIHIPIVADTESTGNKWDKIEKLVPYFKRGDIIFNQDLKEDSDYERFVSQFTDFERGSKTRDDAPDATVEAMLKLNKRVSRRGKEKAYISNPRRKPKGSY